MRAGSDATVCLQQVSKQPLPYPKSPSHLTVVPQPATPQAETKKRRKRSRKMADPHRGATTTPKEAMILSAVVAITSTAYCIYDERIRPGLERQLQKIICEKIKHLTYCLADLSVFERSAGVGAPVNGSVMMEDNVYNATRVDISMRFYFAGNYLSTILELKVSLPRTHCTLPLTHSLSCTRRAPTGYFQVPSERREQAPSQAAGRPLDGEHAPFQDGFPCLVEEP